MKCLNCGGEFIPPQNINISFKTCPFCKASILDEETAKEFKNFADFLQYIVSVYSINIYKEKQKLANLISDLYTGEERLKRVYRRAVLEDAVSLRIYDISLKSKEERILFYNQIVASFTEENFCEQEFAEDVINSFVKGISLDLKWEICKLVEKAKLGDIDAQNNLGKCYENGRDVVQSYEKAVEWYRKAAEQGHAAAQYNLGVCYAEGRGVVQSYENAVKWYRKAAEQGEVNAQNNLGVCYDNGQGVVRNYEKAVEWYRKAAEQGHAAAQYNLGVCYAKGRGVVQSYENAVEWYRKAAEQGNMSAQKWLKKII